MSASHAPESSAESDRPRLAGDGDGVCRLDRLLAVTALASLGTGVFWHGVPFIAESVHGFSARRTIALLAVMGFVYASGAALAHRFVSFFRIGPRTLVIGSVVLQAAGCLPALLIRDEWTIWVGGIVVQLAASQTWPMVEAYLGAGRHGAPMRRAIAWFNLTWMAAVAIPMLVVGPLMDRAGAATIGVLGITSLVAAVIATGFPAVTAPHDVDEAGRAVAPSYPFLLRASRAALPLSYVFMAAMSPLLPYRFKAIGTEVDLATPAAATWMAARFAVLVLMWRRPFWHGRWWPLAAGLACVIGGFAGIMLAGGVATLLVSLAVFGIGAGVAYYTALYYALAVGHAGVEAGGRHEALIGAGYAAGPLIALAGLEGGGWIGVRGDVGVVLLFGVVTLVALRPPLAAWRADRRRRSRLGDSDGSTSADADA